MSNKQFDPEELAHHLDNLLAGKYNTFPQDDPLIDVAHQLMDAPRPIPSVDALKNMQARMLKASTHHVSQSPVSGSKFVLMGVIATVAISIVLIGAIWLITATPVLESDGTPTPPIDTPGSTVDVTVEITPEIEQTDGLVVTNTETRTATITETETTTRTSTETLTATTTSTETSTATITSTLTETHELEQVEPVMSATPSPNPSNANNGNDSPGDFGCDQPGNSCNSQGTPGGDSPGNSGSNGRGP